MEENFRSLFNIRIYTLEIEDVDLEYMLLLTKVEFDLTFRKNIM